MEPHQLWVPIALFVIVGAVATLALLLWFLDRRHDRAVRLQLAELGEAIDGPTIFPRDRMPDALRSEGVVLLGTALGFAGTSAAAAITGLNGTILALPLAVAAVLAGAGLGKVVASLLAPRTDTQANKQ